MLTLRHQNGRTEILPVAAGALPSDRHRVLQVLVKRHAQRRTQVCAKAGTQVDPRLK
ncbi:hypothetical protein PATSB16_31260 [Pandoraea thiooxydans]|nr:hypothetical protein PATSB16_31260 [Pandoraea thiooxydans]